MKDGTRKELVNKAKEGYRIEGKVVIAQSTIDSRTKSEKLTVWNTGLSSLVLVPEVFLISMIISAWEVNYPLAVGKIMQVANNLVEGTEWAAKIIKWKIAHHCYVLTVSLLGIG